MMGDAECIAYQQLSVKGEVEKERILTQHILVYPCADSSDMLWHLALENENKYFLVFSCINILFLHKSMYVYVCVYIHACKYSYFIYLLYIYIYKIRPQIKY